MADQKPDAAATTASPDGSPGADTAPEQTQPELSPHQQKMAKLRHEHLGEELPAGVELEDGGDEGEEEAVDVAAEGLEGDLGDVQAEGVDGDGEEGGDVAAAAAEGEEEGGELPEGVEIVTLPGRRPEDPDFELPLSDELLEAAGIDKAEAIERINQLKNSGLRRRELDEAMSAVSADQADLDALYDELESDPAGFLLEKVHPSVRGGLAEEMLAALDDDAFNALVKKIDRWARSPETRDVARTKSENERLKGAKNRQESRARAQRDLKAARAVGDSVRGLVPEGMDEGKAGRFFQASLGAIRRHVRENKLTALDPAEVPELLASFGLLEDYGISANGGDAGSQEDPPKKSSSTNGRPAKKPESSSSSKAKGSSARDRLKRRREAATTPAGAGATAGSGIQKVPGETYEERRNRVARAIGVPEKKMHDR